MLKIANAPTAGRINGIKTWESIWSKLQPSMRAASKYSLGICLKYCLIRKIPNGDPMKGRIKAA